MNPIPAIAFALLSSLISIDAATLSLSAPIDYQITQRRNKETGLLTITGKLAEAEIKDLTLEARLLTDSSVGAWKKLAPRLHNSQFEAQLEAQAGGWYRMEVRALKDGQTFTQAVVEHVGLGEVFVVAGQSNSANHGAEKQQTKTGQVATFDGSKWQLSHDPQPGASGQNGSFMPPLGDALAQRFKVPIGFIACGIGSTSVREWLPAGSTFPNPPTLVSRVHELPSGQWASNGEAFESFVGRLKPIGPHGFRAVLWHQGESDANQKDPTRTLAGPLYRQSLEKLISESRHQLAWEVPWFVAQASYHAPGDEASPEIRAAQASLWKDGIALEGPDSDALKGELRENAGKGVHLSGPGLREHAILWFEKLAPWLEQVLTH